MNAACRTGVTMPKGLNTLADRGDFAGITRKINGGLNGQADRSVLWARARKVLGV
jgi:putative chitinase